MADDAAKAPKAQSAIRFARNVGLLGMVWLPGALAVVGLAIGAMTLNVTLLIVSACVAAIALYAWLRTPKVD